MQHRNGRQATYVDFVGLAATSSASEVQYSSCICSGYDGKNLVCWCNIGKYEQLKNANDVWDSKSGLNKENIAGNLLPK
jgi:hypothetical protein